MEIITCSILHEKWTALSQTPSFRLCQDIFEYIDDMIPDTTGKNHRHLFLEVNVLGEMDKLVHFQFLQREIILLLSVCFTLHM